MVLLFGQAVGATKATYSEFDRKNYFYPDIPKAYQISQYAFPFLTKGSLNGVELTRVHLEEDTARSQHDKGEGSVVDFNRAGVPLMELVTEPVIHDSATAGDFARELQLLLRTLGISEANMEKGEMRVEANISVSDTDELGTKVEVKNLNSFKSVEAAIEYEIKRHIETLEKGEEIKQETRGWDEVKLKTFSQRSKETAKDYRYFPDPDISKIDVSAHEQFSDTSLSEIMPKLPNEKRKFMKNLGVTSSLIEVVLQDSSVDKLVTESLTAVGNSEQKAKLIVNYATSDIPALVNEGYKVDDLSFEHFVELVDLLEAKKIGSRVGKDLLPKLFGSDVGPLEIAERENLLQITDAAALKTMIDEVVAENESVVEEYKAGKEASLKFLVGQGMKKSRGSADPSALQTMLIDVLK